MTASSWHLKVCYSHLIAFSRREDAQTHRPLTQCKPSQVEINHKKGMVNDRKKQCGEKRIFLEEKKIHIIKWITEVKAQRKKGGVGWGVSSQPHAVWRWSWSWQGGGKSSSRHFAFQMKAKLKLRHGLLNIWTTEEIKTNSPRHNNVRRGHSYDQNPR